MIATFIRRIRGTAALKERASDGVAPIALDDSGFVRVGQSGNTRTLVDAEQTQTLSGAKTLSGGATLSGTNTLSGATTVSAALSVTAMATFTGGTKGVPWDGITTTGEDTIAVAAADSGTVYYATKSSATQTFSLPATAAGLTYTFICGHADGEINISPVAADKITGKGFATADDGDIKNTAASNAVGDTCTLVGDGADGWIATVVVGTWANV